MKYSEPFVTNNLCNPNNNGLLTLFPCILFYQTYFYKSTLNKTKPLF